MFRRGGDRRSKSQDRGKGRGETSKNKFTGSLSEGLKLGESDEEE